MTVHKKNQYQHQVSTNINTGKKTRILTFCYETNPFFFGGYLCNVTLFISLDHLNKLWIIRRFKTLPNTQNLLFNIYIISKSKHAQKEYMTDIKSFFILHFQTKSSSLKRILDVYRVNYLRMLMACDLPFQHDSRSL